MNGAPPTNFLDVGIDGNLLIPPPNTSQNVSQTTLEPKQHRNGETQQNTATPPMLNDPYQQPMQQPLVHVAPPVQYGEIREALPSNPIPMSSLPQTITYTQQQQVWQRHGHEDTQVTGPISLLENSIHFGDQQQSVATLVTSEMTPNGLLEQRTPSGIMQGGQTQCESFTSFQAQEVVSQYNPPQNYPTQSEYSNNTSQINNSLTNFVDDLSSYTGEPQSGTAANMGTVQYSSTTESGKMNDNDSKRNRSSVTVPEEILANIRTKKTKPAVEGIPLFAAHLQKRGGRPKGKGSSRTAEERKEHRKELNRRNAYKSRLRKKYNLEEKIIQLAALEEENRKLKKQVGAQQQNASNGNEATDILLRDARLVQLQNHFPNVGEGALSVHETFELNNHLKGKVGNEVSMVMTMPDSNAKQLLRYATPAFFDLVGYTPEEVMGKNMSMFQGPHTNKTVVQVIRDSIIRQQPVHAKLLNYKKDGTSFWIELQIAPLKGATEGATTGWIGVIKPIDIQKLAESAGIDATFDFDEDFLL